VTFKKKIPFTYNFVISFLKIYRELNVKYSGKNYSFFPDQDAGTADQKSTHRDEQGIAGFCGLVWGLGWGR